MNRATDVHKTLQAHRPAALDELANEAYDRRRGNDLARSMLATAEPAGRRVRTIRRPALLLTGVSAACLLAAGGVIVATGQDGSPAGRTARGGPAATVDARQFLLASAHVAEKAPFRTGHYWYIRSQNTLVDSGYRTVIEGKGSQARKVKGKIAYTAYRTTPAEVWVGRDPSDVIRKTSDMIKITFPTPADQAKWKLDPENRQNSPDKPRTWQRKGARLSVGQREMTVKELAALPTDVRGLEVVLRAQYARDQKATKNRFDSDFVSYVWGIAQDLLAGPLSPGSKGAFYKVLAKQPGVRMDGAVKDQLGRPGMAVTVTSKEDGGAGRISNRLVISPKTGQLLANERWAGKDRVDSTTYETMGWVDKLGATL